MTTSPSQKPTESSFSLPENVSERFLEYMHAPKNLGELASPNGTAIMTGHCGDSIGVHVLMDQHVLKEVRVQPKGCVYTLVCAGAMSVLAQGHSIDEIMNLEPEDIANELGGLPHDHMHCATLALNALGDALAEYYEDLIKTKQLRG